MYVGNFFWRAGTYDDGTEVASGQLALSLVALALLGASGWLGGKLAYRFGVRVADEVPPGRGVPAVVSCPLSLD